MSKYYISFGQTHTHSINGKTINKDCLVELESENKEAAHTFAMKIFNGTFHNIYAKLIPKLLSYFPRGVIKL